MLKSVHVQDPEASLHFFVALNKDPEGASQSSLIKPKLRNSETPVLANR
jgi:hypothetical protein